MLLIRLTIFLTAITLPWIVHFFGTVNYYSDYIKSKLQSGDDPVFDFIVVGSGSGGAVVAHRLSTNKNVKVLLLEAGGDPSPLNHIPGFAMDLLGHESTDWKHLTVPQKHACGGLYNKQSSWNAGKTLGGSTTLNYLMYLRGSPFDYDNWANITGDDEWSYKNVLPFFKKSIKSYRGWYKDNKKHHGESDYGFLNIEARPWAPLQREFLDATKEFGFPEIDINGGSQRSGAGIIEALVKKGKRFGTYSAIVVDLEKRPNVKISRFSHVTKIKLDKNLRAEGVWYVRHGIKKLARASREVIISAGSVNSPKILMLSGIGPKDHLEAVHIKTKVNLPTGRNLHDHATLPLMPFVIDEPKSVVLDRDFLPSVFMDYFKDGTGLLTTPNVVHSQLFYSSKKVKDTGVDWPDTQIFFSAAGMYEMFRTSFSNSIKIRSDVLKPVLDPHIGKDGMILIVTLVRPKSRGDVKLRSKNPFEPPLIDPHYLENKDDVDALVDAMKNVVKIIENGKQFKAMNSRLELKEMPGCEEHKYRSDAYWQCFARLWTMSVWHPVGTCKMGRSKGDKTAVVDTKLRVLKTTGLRVIDASIMPFVVNANTMGPTIMIGEKGAHFIREYWSEQFLVSDVIDHFLKRDLRKCYYTHMV